MFQTEPILILQAFANASLTRLAVLINGIGYAEFQLPLVLVVVFGFNLRRGFLLMQAMLWNEALTSFLKQAVALPRPADVDAAVRLLPEGVPAQQLFIGRGATGFFSLPPADVVAHYRSVQGYSYGLPSGHITSTVAMWGSLAALFRRGWIVAAAVTMAVLAALTRMYLGRHFLADVLAGAVVGFLPVLVLLGQGEWETLVAPAHRMARWARATWLLLAPGMLLFIPGVEEKIPARLVGLGAAYLLLRARGLPLEGGTLGQRAGRLALAGLTLGLGMKGAAPILRAWLAGGWAGRTVPEIVTAFALLFVVAEACLLLRLYPGREVSPEAAAD